jgi:hypothetical protein
MTLINGNVLLTLYKLLTLLISAPSDCGAEDSAATTSSCCATPVERGVNDEHDAGSGTGTGTTILN